MTLGFVGYLINSVNKARRVVSWQGSGSKGDGCKPQLVHFVLLLGKRPWSVAKASSVIVSYSAYKCLPFPSHPFYNLTVSISNFTARVQFQSVEERISESEENLWFYNWKDFKKSYQQDPRVNSKNSWEEGCFMLHEMQKVVSYQASRTILYLLP